MSAVTFRGLSRPRDRACAVPSSSSGCAPSIFRWTSAGVIDFDNSARKTSATEELSFQNSRLHVPQGAYLVQFNEIVATLLDATGEVFVRSSSFRSGAVVTAGLIDAGYHGSLGAVLQVLNPHGVHLHQNARLAQIVFREMNGEVEGSSSVY
ncbi:putative dUTPase [Lyophyllum shimeji]|uniref:dUTPase n=1 Tax=Lyophyllum shimeji TaxID=47721 RepID=A0A9P3UJ10_LYOSH|nr:putative dUTPase [Lyophyllum shimeji]